MTTRTKIKNNINPAAAGLTDAQSKALCILTNRQTKGLTTTPGDLAKDWKGKHRSYAYKVLKVLCDKKLVERYSTKYYKLAETETA